MRLPALPAMTEPVGQFGSAVTSTAAIPTGSFFQDRSHMKTDTPIIQQASTAFVFHHNHAIPPSSA